MPNPQTNLRLDPAIRDRAIAAAKAQGITVAALVERALVAYLDGGIAGDSTVLSDSSSDTRALSNQIADLIARVKILESRFCPSQDAQEGRSKPFQVSQHLHTPATAPTEGQYQADGVGHPKADGQRWLATNQAVQVSAARGGPDNRSSLMKWAEDGRLASLGLGYRPHGTKDKMLATFEDLRFEV